MSAIELGKRYERLMVSSVPLAIAAAFLLFTSIASKEQGANRGRCYELAASAVTTNKRELGDEWAEYQKYKDVPGYSNVYKYHLRLKWMEAINPGIFGFCKAMTAEIEDSGEIPPAELEKKWLAEARKRIKGPVAMYGISIESETQITVLGTKVRVQLATLTTALQFALGPLLILWLGSLYQTRFRESIYNARARNLVEVYPHLINVYPVLVSLSLKKRVKLLLFVQPHVFWAAMYTCLRILFVAIVLSPTVALYLWSLWLIPSQSQTFSHLALGIIVSIFTFGVLIVEALPWHWPKTFPNVEPH